MHWIRRMRLEKGWSQKELAKKAGCTVGLIDMLEEADGEVTHWQIANRIAGALGVDALERNEAMEARDMDVLAYPSVQREVLKLDIGSGVRREREKKGLTQTELADLVAVSGATISNIERGRKDCTLVLGVQIARALGCSIDELLAE